MNDQKEQAPDLVHQEQFKKLKQTVSMLWFIVMLQGLAIFALNIRIGKVVHLANLLSEHLVLLSEKINLVAHNINSLTHCVDRILEIVKTLIS